MSKLKPGDKVYGIVEYDFPDDKPHTWRVAEGVVSHATDRQITLEAGAHALKLSGVRFKPRALGAIFHVSREGAIDRFIAERNEEVASANRKIITASRALAWARAERRIADALSAEAKSRVGKS